ncbi:GerB family spore germination protein [Bacillus thuringiensis serovar kurstaki str. HD-1]|nr:GerB family spore germination protein [Bacillus thuringiensis serovar kurstaki str. HD-1]
MGREKKQEYALLTAWGASFIATLGSLYFSEIMKFEPCVLCWYQRIFMYPFVLWLGIAVAKKDYRIASYSLPIASIGVILKNAGYDAWISLIIAGIATHIVLFCMLKMLEKDGDLISIHTTTFGKWVGSIFSVIFTLYCLLFCLTVLRTYMEVIQVWIYRRIYIKNKSSSCLYRRNYK